jgi:hypothetical protein
MTRMNLSLNCFVTILSTVFFANCLHAQTPDDFILVVDSDKVQRSGAWEKSVSNRYTYPEHLFTENNGSSLEVQFQGSGLVLVLEAPNNTSYGGREKRGPSSGTVEVLVDGVKQIEATLETTAREMTVVRNRPNGTYSAKVVYNGSYGRCRILGFRVLQGPSGDVEMDIQSEEESPLIDVRAIVSGNGAEIRNTRNRNWVNGAAALAGLPVGEYDLEIRALGWVTHRQKITVEDGIKTNLGTIVLKQDPATKRNGFEFPAQGHQAVIKQGEGIEVVGPTSGVLSAKLRRQHGPAIFTREVAFSGNTLTVSGDTPPGLYDLILTTSTGEARQAPRSVYVVKDYPENPAFMGWGHLDVWGQQRTEFIHRVVEMVNLMGVDMVLIANAVNAAYYSGAMADLDIPYLINFGNHEFDGHEKWYGPDVHFFDYGPQIQILNFALPWSNESLAKSMWDTRDPAPIRIINSFEGDASSELLDGYNIKLVHYAHGNALGNWILCGTRGKGTYLAGKYIRYMPFNNNQTSPVPGHHIDTDGLREPELKLNAVFSPANDGTHQNVSAEVTNEYIPVPNGRLVFLMPAGSYEVDHGTIESEVTSDDGKYTLVTVRTPFPVNQKTTVSVLQSAKRRARQPLQMTWPQITQQAKPWTRWWWMGSSVDKKKVP